jgi:hypothetical protein
MELEKEKSKKKGMKWKKQGMNCEKEMEREEGKIIKKRLLEI